MKIKDGYEYGEGNPRNSYYQDHMRKQKDGLFWFFILAAAAVFGATLLTIYL